MNLIAEATPGLAETLQQLWEDPMMSKIVTSGLILLLGLPIAALIVKLVFKLIHKRFSKEVVVVLARAIRWSLFLVVIVGATLPFIGYIKAVLTGALLVKLVAVSLILLIGFPLSAIAGRIVQGVGSRRFSPEVGLIFARAVRWFLVGVIIATVLSQFGVNLGAALGAAGIVGIAVGFAAQTSLSNVISGFFLLGEKPFVVGDLIEVDGVTGTVDKIGMISASIRTPDNRSVRIPNETLVKSKVSNITGNPIRRYDMEVGLAYDEDIEHVMAVLRKVAEDNPHCLDEPNPLVLFLGFGDSSINFLFGCWMVKTDYLLVRNSIAAEVQKAFIREGIEIPFPHQVLAGGKASAPIRIQMEK